MLQIILATLKMKKYRKIIFYALFFCVFLGLIIYRTEYLKMRYTFEVGGLLTPPEMPSDCLVINDSVSQKHADFNFFSLPRNYWTQLNEFHIFSAFMMEVEESYSSIALGIGKNKQDCLNYNCQIWYTAGGLKLSLKGIFSCERFGGSKSNSTLFEFNCKVDPSNIRGIPYMFIILDKSNQSYFIPVHHGKMKVSVNPRSALCIFPDFSGLEHLYIIEFLSYHQLIGFTDIIVYDNNVQYGILNSLEHVLSNMDYFKTFSVIPWNFPLNDNYLGEELIKKDCFYRTQGHVNFTTLASWNDYLIPVKNKTIFPIFQKLNNKKTAIVNVNTKKCCINSKSIQNSDRSWPLIFRKTACVSQYHDNLANLSLSKQLSLIELVNVPKEEIYMNKYSLCDESEVNFVQDTAALKYLIDLIGNKLLGIWRSGTLFET